VTERRIRSENERWRVSLAMRGAVAALFTVAFLAAWFVLPLREWLQAFTVWIGAAGWPGYVLFAGLYVLASLLLAPGALLTIAAGLSFGWSGGLAIVAIAASLAAALAYAFSRYVFRRQITRLMEARPRLKALDRAVARQGWKAVLLLRLSGLVPFNLQSYLFGATGIGFWPYLAATLLGIVPGATLFSYLGATAGLLAEGGARGPEQWLIFGAGLAATLAAALLVARSAKRHLAVRTEI
jgi:uncharacterized membrane protein YdjX (TVP38/TMEM64 family)